MADFNFNLLTHSPETKRVVSTALGAAADEGWTDKERGKAVKMGAKSNHVPCAAGDEIEGFVDTVRGDTVNEGFSFGGVSRGGRHEAKIGAAQTPAAKVLDYVVADAQDAVGTEGIAQVKTGEPTKHMWRIVRLIGDGEAGSTVVLERDE